MKFLVGTMLCQGVQIGHERIYGLSFLLNSAVEFSTFVDHIRTRYKIGIEFGLNNAVFLFVRIG